LILVLILSFANLTWGHLPHDEVYFLATPEDGSAKGPWVSYHFDAAAQSSDGGERWQNMGGDLFLHGGHEGFTLADGSILVCGTEGLWHSTDMGDSWSEFSIEGDIADCAMQGEEIVVASDQGLFFGTYDAPLTSLASGIYTSVDWAVDWISAVNRDGSIYLSRAGKKGTRLEGPKTVIISTTVMNDTPLLFVGDQDGRVWALRSGVWAPCADMPAMDRPAVMHMGVFGDSLLALPANQGPYQTDSDCGAWEDRSTPELTGFSPSPGGAVSDAMAFTTMRLGEHAWVVAGWAGIYISEDQGVSWRESWIGATDRTMSVVYHPDFPKNPRIWFATYASGVGYTDDLGQTFQSPSFAFPTGNAQYLSAVPGNDGLIFATDNWDLVSSADDGVTWSIHDDPFEQLLDILVFAADDIWLIAKYDADTFPGRVAYSADGGENWMPVSAVEKILNTCNNVTRFPTGDGYRYCMADDNGVACTDDRDGEWTLKNSYKGSQRSSDFAVWPGEVAPAIAYGTEKGIYSSTDLGETWVLSYDAGEAEVVDVAVSPQGIGLALTRSGNLISSDDGFNWTEITTTINAWGYSLNFRPDIDGPTEALVGTSTGVIRLSLTDGLWSADPFGVYQCIDSAANYVECDDCTSANEAHKDAWMSHALRVAPDIEMEMYIRGSTLTIRGASDADSMALVSLTELGLTYEIGGVDSDGFGELLRIDGLEDRTHFITITHLTGDGVLFDALEAYAAGVTLSSNKPPVTDTGETAETGTSYTDSEETSPPGETGIDDTGSSDSCGCDYRNATSTIAWMGLMMPVLMVRRRKVPGPS
jgi:photosystem II stability/assembly factor-like uncharacterized protein